jgi:threonine/homoserine/homoserine lactone efflux protein
MFDARFLAFAGLSALLVLTPGATFAVVVETALGSGRTAALMTVAGVGLANATLATAAAFGMSALFGRWPAALELVRIAGGVYLAWLGLRGLWGARHLRASVAPAGGRGTEGRATRSAFVVRGLLTNLLNPPVWLFYMSIVPQFIGPQDAYLARALLLGATHVAMSVVWQGFCGVAVGFAADHVARPSVRRVLEGVTGAALVVMGARLLV